MTPRVDTPELRKARGAFFTPPQIADYLARWAIRDDKQARVLDPTCGEAVFLLAAAERLRELGVTQSKLASQVHGVDLHMESLEAASSLLGEGGLAATLHQADFFDVPSPNQLGCPLPVMDAVIGNPPFVRYQEHKGRARQKSQAAALAQGVRLNGLASSWAATLVHACSFLRPGTGRLAMVVPAELLTVHYAEPIRRWLRQRFASVHLVMFEELQFEDALEKVVLLVAWGSGGCDAFSVYQVSDADDLGALQPFDNVPVAPAAHGKWTDMLLPMNSRQLFRRTTSDHFVPLSSYGRIELGAVTGANDFFAMTEETRQQYGLSTDQVRPISPPGTRHLKGFSFSSSDWQGLRERGERVWVLNPDSTDNSDELLAYIAKGEKKGIQNAYKCRVRRPWWRPSLPEAPDLFFTYMSHRYPRLVANSAKVSFLNSMHGLRLASAPKEARYALPLLSLSSVSMLGAEIYGRSYGGGVLKMEPTEAAALPVPDPEVLQQAWGKLRGERSRLDTKLRRGLWANVVKRVDEVLLGDCLGMSETEISSVYDSARVLRQRRLGVGDEES